MDIEKLMKKIDEVKYLSTENTDRYRPIMRYFYLQHERLRQFISPEELFDYLSEIPQFKTYNMGALNQDLEQLTQWGNLKRRQDVGNISKIEDFKKKQFRYRCTPYTVEIERMVIALEKLGDTFGGSLEKTYIEKILSALVKLLKRSEKDGKINFAAINMSNSDLFGVWSELQDNFKKLTENATDYIAHIDDYLESENIEQNYTGSEYLKKKNELVQYLRNFMLALQRTTFRIEDMLSGIPKWFISAVAEKLADYYLKTPRAVQPDKDDLINDYLQQWEILRHSNFSKVNQKV